MRVAAVMTGGAFGHVKLEESGACRSTRIAPNCSRPVSPRSSTRPFDKQQQPSRKKSVFTKEGCRDDRP